MGSYKEILINKYQQFDASDSDELRLLLKFEIKNIVGNTLLPDAEDFYILGLVTYDSLENRHDMDEAREFFVKALEVDEKYNMARLYLAHCYHDNDELSKALENYLAVDTIELRSEFALWRYVKLIEQIGYCYYKLGNTKEAESCFNEVVGFYESEPYDELVDPVEIYDCLGEDDHVYQVLKKVENDYYKKSWIT